METVIVICAVSLDLLFVALVLTVRQFVKKFECKRFSDSHVTIARPSGW